MTHKPTVLIVGEGLDEAHEILPKAPRGRLRGLLRALICRRCGLFGPANDRLRYCQPGHALLRGTVRAAAGHRKGSTPASSRGGTLSGYGGLFGGYAYLGAWDYLEQPVSAELILKSVTARVSVGAQTG